MYPLTTAVPVSKLSYEGDQLTTSASTAATDVALSPPTRTLTPGRIRLIVISAIATVVLVAGSLTGVALYNSAQAAAAEERAAAAAAAADAALVERYSGSLVYLQARGQVTVDDAAALAASTSALLSDTELATLASIAAVLDPVLEHGIPAGANAAQAKAFYATVLTAVDAGYTDLGTVVTAASAAAQVALAASPSADAATRQAVVDAQAALEAAFAGHGTVVEAFTALDDAVTAAAASHAAAVALAAAAAAAAASGASTYSYGGTTYYTNPGGNGGNGGGNTGGGDTGGGTTTPPAYTDAQARDAVVSAYGASAKGADCDPMNWGTWSPGSTPPPPAMNLIGGGWLGYTAWSIGNGGEVHYWACY